MSEPRNSNADEFLNEMDNGELPKIEESETSNFVSQRAIDTMHILELPEVIYETRFMNIPEYSQEYEALFLHMKELCEKYKIDYEKNANVLWEKFLMDLQKAEQSMEIPIDIKECSHGINSKTTEEFIEDARQSCQTIDDVNTLMQNCERLFTRYRHRIAKFYKNREEYGKLLSAELKLVTIEEMILEIEDQITQIIRQQQNCVGYYNEFEDRFLTAKEVEANFERRKQSLLEQKNELPRDEKVVAQEFMELLIILPRLNSEYLDLKDKIQKLDKLELELKLREFHSNPEFMDELHSIMEHDVNEYEYLFHGTTCVEDAEGILSEGLCMQREDLGTTTYSELTEEQLLLYSRGWGGEVGQSAIVIIRKPNDKEIVRVLTDEEKSGAQVAQSGLGGFGGVNYIIPKEYIVGYVNKRDKKVIKRNLSNDKENSTID